jgi:hypothetical protein
MFCIIFCIKLFLWSYIFIFCFIATQTKQGYRLFVPSLPILTPLPNVTDVYTTPPVESEVEIPMNEPLPVPSLEISIPEIPTNFFI